MLLSALQGRATTAYALQGIATTAAAQPARRGMVQYASLAYARHERLGRSRTATKFRTSLLTSRRAFCCFVFRSRLHCPETPILWHKRLRQKPTILETAGLIYFNTKSGCVDKVCRNRCRRHRVCDITCSLGTPDTQSPQCVIEMRDLDWICRVRDSSPRLQTLTSRMIHDANATCLELRTRACCMPSPDEARR